MPGRAVRSSRTAIAGFHAHKISGLLLARIARVPSAPRRPPAFCSVQFPAEEDERLVHDSSDEYSDLRWTATGPSLVRRLREERNRFIEGLRRIATIQEALRCCLLEEQCSPAHDAPERLLELLGRAQMAATAVVDLVNELLSAPPELSAWIEHHNGAAHLFLVGELDIATRSHILAALDSVAKENVKEVVVHMDFLKFLDCAGITPLVTLANELSAHGGSVRVIGASPQQKKILSLTAIVFDE